MRPILILAAGASTRMRGRDKLLEEIEGQAQLRRIAQRALATGHPVAVALPQEPHPRYDVISDLDVRRIPVPDASEGLNASLRRGIAALQDADGIMIVLADLVELDTPHFETVFAAQSKQPDATVWRGTTSNGKSGHPTLVNRTMFESLKTLTGDAGAQSVLQSAQVCKVPLPGNAARVDLDTPEEWEAWRACNDPSSSSKP